MDILLTGPAGLLLFYTEGASSVDWESLSSNIHVRFSRKMARMLSLLENYSRTGETVRTLNHYLHVRAWQRLANWLTPGIHLRHVIELGNVDGSRSPQHSNAVLESATDAITKWLASSTSTSGTHTRQVMRRINE